MGCASSTAHPVVSTKQLMAPATTAACTAAVPPPGKGAAAAALVALSGDTASTAASSALSPCSTFAESAESVACSLMFTDKYELGEALGQGCFATVFVALPTACAQERACAPSSTALAVKVVHARAENDGLQPRQRRELAVWSAIGSHKHCVRLWESFVQHSVMHLVMERADCNLSSFLTDRKLSSERNACNIFGQMLAGIAHCHSVNVIHRDIKPENFLVVGKSEDCVVKLADFGFGVVHEGELHFGTYGSAPYLCPEMVLNQGHDTTADVWACGASAYKLLFGEYVYMPCAPISVLGMKNAIRDDAPLPTFRHNKRSTTSTSAAVGGLGGWLSQILIRDRKLRPSASEAIDLLARSLL